MTKEELWNTYVAKNPSFEGDGNVTMSAKGLRKMFDQTWAIAKEAEADHSSEQGGNIFNEIFGKNFRK